MQNAKSEVYDSKLILNLDNIDSNYYLIKVQSKIVIIGFRLKINIFDPNYGKLVTN